MSNFGKRQETHSFLSQTLSRPSLWPLLHISGARSHESTSQDWSKFWVCPHAQLLHGKYAFSTQIPRLERLSLAAELRIPKPLPACRCLALYSQKIWPAVSQNWIRRHKKCQHLRDKHPWLSAENRVLLVLATKRDSRGFSRERFKHFISLFATCKGLIMAGWRRLADGLVLVVKKWP